MPHTKNLKSTTFFAIGAALVIGMALCMPEMAFAATWQSAPKKLYDELMGSFFGNLAALAIVGMAVAALAGKMDWRWAVGIMTSIVVAFSAPAIVDTIKSYVA